MSLPLGTWPLGNRDTWRQEEPREESPSLLPPVGPLAVPLHWIDTRHWNTSSQDMGKSDRKEAILGTGKDCVRM